MYRAIERTQWFTNGILFAACATGFYVYGLSFISKVRFQWWVWSSDFTNFMDHIF